MAIATFIFWRGTKHYVRVPTNRQLQHAGFFKVFWTPTAPASSSNSPREPGCDHRPAGAGDGADDRARFSHRTGVTAQCLGWTALGCIGVWYLLVIVLSLLRKMELPDAFWAGAPPA